MPEEESGRKTGFRYVLKTPVEYAHKGDKQEASFVQLTAPTSRNSKECAALKQAFWRSVAGQEAKDTGGESTGGAETPEGSDVLVMLAMSRDVDLAKVMDHAHHLFTKGRVAKLDDEVWLTQPILESMSQEDVEDMLGEYLVNFTLASSLAQMSGRSSAASSSS